MSKRSAGVAFKDEGDGGPRAAKKAKDVTDSDDAAVDIGADRAVDTGGGAGRGAIGSDESSETLYSLHLVGWKREKKGQGLAVGVDMRLVRDPENKVDPNAIKVFCPSLDRFVGWIMAGEAYHLAPVLDAGDAVVRRAVLREAPPAYLKAKPLRLEICFSKLDLDAKSGKELARVLSIPFDLGDDVGAIADDEPSLPADFAFVHNPEGVSPLAFARRFPPSKQHPSRHWVFVYGNKKEYQGAQAPAIYTGKWMIMDVPPSKIDRWFAEVARSVEAGEFFRAKTNAGPGNGRGGTGVIIAYTKDFRNRPDVVRAGEALKRRFGRAVELKYKADVLTSAGVYAKGRQKSCIYTMKKGGLGMSVEEGLYEASLELASAIASASASAMAATARARAGARAMARAAAAATGNGTGAAATGSGTAQDPIEM